MRIGIINNSKHQQPTQNAGLFWGNVAEILKDIV